MKTPLNVTLFATEADALEHMRQGNRMDRCNVLVVADGPDDDFAVMPIAEAIGLGSRYTWGEP